MERKDNLTNAEATAEIQARVRKTIKRNMKVLKTGAFVAGTGVGTFLGGSLLNELGENGNPLEYVGGLLAITGGGTALIFGWGSKVANERAAQITIDEINQRPEPPTQE